MRLKIISEQGVPEQDPQALEAPEGLQTPQLSGGPDVEMPDEPGEAPEGAPPLANDEAGKAANAIDAVEKLRAAAAGLEAASFAVKTNYSDFSLSERIDQVKQELIYIIQKTKEHAEYSAAKDPGAKEAVTQWLNT